jgi:hypothetical protein
VGTLIGAGILGFLSAVATGGGGAWVGAAFLVQGLRIVLDWMLNGKLICLYRNPAGGCDCGDGGNQVCAVGEVADCEQVGEDKNPIEDVDNDFSLNLILGPVGIATHMALAANGEDRQKNFELRRAIPPQGDLISEQPGMPKFGGYTSTLVMMMVTREYLSYREIIGYSDDESEKNKRYGDFLLANAWKTVQKYEVPVLHCEFEGSRIRDLLSVIDAFSLGGGWCKRNWFFRILCTILQSIFAPLILVLLAVAWAAASSGSQDDALTDGGEVGPRDIVVLRGRWAYDGGHSGYNEVHAYFH